MAQELVPGTFDVPVLVTGFNRPHHLETLLRILLRLNVERLFVSLDGPRPSVPKDESSVEECRQVVRKFAERIEITSVFRDSNLGCGRAMTASINWFFSHVDEGIILEDDIRPSTDFFYFCRDMLVRFRNDPRVFAVAGHDLFTDTDNSFRTSSYRFSSFTCVWGWATWSRSWSLYNFDLKNWREQMSLTQRWRAMGASPMSVNFWSSAFDRVACGSIDTWDYQLVYSQMLANSWTVTPNRNLVENHGFGPNATHTTNPAEVKKVESLEWPLVHPRGVLDGRADRWVIKHVYGQSFRNRMRFLVRRVARVTNSHLKRVFRLLASG